MTISRRTEAHTGRKNIFYIFYFSWSQLKPLMEKHKERVFGRRASERERERKISLFNRYVEYERERKTHINRVRENFFYQQKTTVWKTEREWKFCVNHNRRLRYADDDEEKEETKPRWEGCVEMNILWGVWMIVGKIVAWIVRAHALIMRNTTTTTMPSSNFHPHKLILTQYKKWISHSRNYFKCTSFPPSTNNHHQHHPSPAHSTFNFSQFLTIYH